MPMLKPFQLVWGFNGTCVDFRQYLRRAEGGNRVIQYFERLVTRFEQGGVAFIEAHEQGICP